MEEILAYCGLTCHGCPIYLATREKSDEKKEKMRDEIARLCKERYGIEYMAEDITDCDACLTEGGRLFSGCERCYIRKCAREKSVENCAHCDEYTCERLAKFIVTEPNAEKRLNEIKSRL